MVASVERRQGRHAVLEHDHGAGQPVVRVHQVEPLVGNEPAHVAYGSEVVQRVAARVEMQDTHVDSECLEVLDLVPDERAEPRLSSVGNMFVTTRTLSAWPTTYSWA